MNITSTTTTRRTVALPLALVCAVGISLTACGSDHDGHDGANDTETPAAVGEITIDDPWSRQPADGQTNSAVYGMLTNGTDETITAVAASTDVTETVELHEVIMNEDGTMTMQEKAGGYEIAPGGSLTFEPGGPHIMVLGIDPATYPETVDVDLEFDNGEVLTFTAEVRSLGMDMGDMDEMDHSDMDDMDHSDMDSEMEDE